jgi:Protein of unknwon function (DUF3310)
MTEREHTRSAGVGHTKEAGSAHYRDLKIQPIDYIEANGLGFHEANVVKYVTRWRSVDGLKDLEKAEWYIQRLIEIVKKEQVLLPTGGTEALEHFEQAWEAQHRGETA